MPEDTTQKEYKKEVTMLAYPAEGKTFDARGWADELTDLDMQAQSTRTKEKFHLSFTMPDGIKDFEEDLWKWDLGNSDEEREETLQALKDDLSDSAMVDIDKHLSSTTTHDNSLGQASRVLISGLTSQLPNELPLNHEGEVTMEQSDDGLQWGGLHYDWKVEINPVGFAEKRVLAKESERESDDLYETAGDVACVEYKIEMVSPRRELIDGWTEDVITSLHKALAKRDGIGRVRYTSCEVSETKTGECYNV